MPKPTVRYVPIVGHSIRVWQSAYVTPLDHPGNVYDGTFDAISNHYPATTSRVLSHDADTGRFETLNTIYIPETTNES